MRSSIGRVALLEVVDFLARFLGGLVGDDDDMIDGCLLENQQSIDVIAIA